MRATALLALAGLVLVACKGKDEDEDDDDGGGVCAQTLGVQSGTSTGTDSVSRFSFDVPRGTRSFLVSASGVPGGLVFVTELLDPDGNEPVDPAQYVAGPDFLSAAMIPYSDEPAFNWPVRDVDPELTPGTWTIGFSAYSSSWSPMSGFELDVTVQTNRDSNVSSGCFTVRVVMTPGVAEDEALVAAVHGAVDTWAEIVAGHGITLQASYETGEDLSDRLDQPSVGSSDYAELRASGDEEDLIVVVGETVANSGVILGEAGGIPGNLVPSEHGVVAVGWLLHAGGDGVFDATDITGMGETMAHEIGHYMGLFHPIEIDGGGNPTGYGDALDDTPDCGSYSDCLNQLGTNLMFPYRTCSTAGCERQDDVTGQQAAVLQRFTGMR